MTKFSAILAQAPTSTPGGSPGASGGFMMLGYLLLFGAMIWFMTAQQRKQKKEHEKMLSALKAGDEILSTGGIFGVVSSVKEDRLVVRIGDNNQKVELAKAFVHSVVKKADA